MRLIHFLLVIILFCTQQLSAQKFKNAQFTLFSFTYDIDDEILEHLKNNASEINLKAEDDNAKLTGMMALTMWTLLSKKMQDTFSTYVLPANSFNNKVKYDPYGFPDITIQKAIKLADTKYYFKMIMNIELEVVDSKGVKYAKDEIVPKVSLLYEMYDKNGYVPLRTADGYATALKPIILSKEYLAGMAFYNNKINAPDSNETLWSLFNRVATEVVLELKHQKKK